jgi:hypothetical protein
MKKASGMVWGLHVYKTSTVTAEVVVAMVSNR